MQERSWDVAELKGRSARIEVTDGMAAAAFAWLGVGRIDAGAALRVDFREGLPSSWESPPPKAEPPALETIPGAIPFLALGRTMFPEAGAVEIPCGFAARRIFLLGCTVPVGRPLDVAGHVEIVYEDGLLDRFPLMVGFTLEKSNKLLGKSRALHIHYSGDPFQYYLAIAPRTGTIAKIRLAREGAGPGQPAITAITCEGVGPSAASTPTAGGEGASSLEELPTGDLGPEERAWIEAHTLRRDSPDMVEILGEIRRAHQIEFPPRERPSAVK